MNKTKEEWDKEFEESIKNLDEQNKKDMRLWRKFAIGILDNEQWTNDVINKVNEEMI